MKVFGPVPSRRLGRSIGVNNIPPKICSLSCVYCQLGRSLKMETDRRDYYSTEELIEEVKKKIEDSRKNNEEIDYLTVVPDGEPTLDINLGKLITALNTTGIKTAVITNSTLIERPDVREELALAHWVSVKVDAVDEAVWRKVDRPVRSIDLDHMLDGILRFSEIYKGKLVW